MFETNEDRRRKLQEIQDQAWKEACAKTDDKEERQTIYHMLMEERYEDGYYED